MILVTGATGMFGGQVLDALLERKAPVRGLTSAASKAPALQAKGAEAAVGNMDKPETLAAALKGVERVFLVSPMDMHVAEREINVINAAKAVGVRQIVKLFGAVRHRGDQLASLHRESIEALQASSLGWALISPNTTMESNLLTMAPAILSLDTIYGAAGDGAMGMVAVGDCARAAAVVLTGDLETHHGKNYEITGPEVLTFTDIAKRFSRILGRPIAYQDMPIEAFGELLVKEAGFPAESVEIDVLCHHRAFRRGDADLVTDTYKCLTGLTPMTVDEFIAAHRSAYG
jgi:uncharacterized protein YbjT (DUF2867 family)